MGRTQIYEMEIEGRHHRVETSVGEGWSNEATWWVDGEQIATASSKVEDNLYLSAGQDKVLAESLGAVRARFTSLSKPVRATWFDGNQAVADAAARIGAGGIDLVPEAGSPAALREERMRARPRLHAARHVVGGVGKVVMPLLFAALMIWLAGRIPWPSINLPAIPWPSIDLPSIPWPDWELPRLDWDAPGWLIWLAEHAKYVIPILIGLALGRREMTRRREQDELRERLAAGVPSAHEGGEGAEPDAVDESAGGPAK